MRRERANILRRLKGNAALIMGKNTAVTFLRGCRRLPLDHKYVVDEKLKQKALPTLLEVLQALEECTVGFRLASDREISEILGTEAEEIDHSQKLVGTFIGELKTKAPKVHGGRSGQRLRSPNTTSRHLRPP